MAAKITIDAIGEQCPIPVVKAKKALDQAQPGDQLEIRVDNEIAVQNPTKMAKSMSSTSSFVKHGDKEYTVTVLAAGNGQKALPEAEVQESAVITAEPKSSDIVVVNSAWMGVGDEALGSILMKGFFYALSQSDHVPAKILFYNTGIYLTTEGSETIADLKTMAAQGTEILSCGTCLDFYQRKDKLLVGEIGNMYDIVEAMSKAGKIIRP